MVGHLTAAYQYELVVGKIGSKVMFNVERRVRVRVLRQVKHEPKLTDNPLRQVMQPEPYRYQPSILNKTSMVADLKKKEPIFGSRTVQCRSVEGVG